MADELFNMIMALENVLDLPAELKEFSNEADLSSKRCGCGWVFWRSNRHHHQEISSSACGSTIQERIRRVFASIASDFSPWGPSYLVQFWAPQVVDGRCYLTTSDQPFALGNHLHDRLYQYRKHCMSHHYLVGEGPPGRVFRNHHQESSPDVKLYSKHIYFGAKISFIALPVFEFLWEECLGVLEISSITCKGIRGFHFDILETALKEENLKSTHVSFQPILPWQPHKGDQEVAVEEIKRMLELVTDTPQLLLAHLWVPCNQCADINYNLSCMELALYESNNELYGNHRFLDWWWIYEFQKVKTGKGIVGILLASEHKACFCPDLTGFSITEQPQTHNAQQSGLDVCFAICLQSSHTRNDLYILEFFLDQGSRKYEHVLSFLKCLLPIMEHTLKSFKIASGKQLGDELVIKVITFGKDYGFTSVELPQPDNRFPLRFEITPYGQEMEQNQQVGSDGLDSGRNVAEAEQNNIATAKLEEEVRDTTMESRRERNKMSFHISRDDIERHRGKPMKEVIEKLGVSRSTFKRALREYGIDRWPSNRKNKNNPLLYQATNANKRVRSSSHTPSDLPLTQNVSHSDISESSQHVTKLPDVDVVMVKTIFGDDIMKFQFRISSGLDKLIKEVAKKHDLKIGSFKLKYLDEDDQWITLATDDDLQLCTKTLKSFGKTSIQVLVH